MVDNRHYSLSKDDQILQSKESLKQFSDKMSAVEIELKSLKTENMKMKQINKNLLE